MHIKTLLLKLSLNPQDSTHLPLNILFHHILGKLGLIGINLEAFLHHSFTVLSTYCQTQSLLYAWTNANK
jgi:hypothetical protein